MHEAAQLDGAPGRGTTTISTLAARRDLQDLNRFGREQPRAVTPAEKWERLTAVRKPARNAVATNARGEPGACKHPPM